MTTTTLQNIPLSNNNENIFKSDLIHGYELRVIGTLENPLFIAKDVAKMLEYKDPKKAIKAHIDEEDIFTYEQGQESRGGESPPRKIQSQNAYIDKDDIFTYYQGQESRVGESPTRKNSSTYKVN